MNYLLLTAAKTITHNRCLGPTMLKYPISNFKTYYYGSGYFIPAKNFSWTGFYSALAQSTPVVTLQNLLIDLHQVSGLPWWSVIVLTTLGIRSIMVFPLTVHQNQVMSRLANINAEMGNIASQLNQEVNVARRLYNWNEEESKKVFKRQMRKIHNDSIIRENCHPFKAVLLVFIQVPVWICFSLSLRNITALSNLSNVLTLELKGRRAENRQIRLSNLKRSTVKFNTTNLSDFKSGGILWFKDLTCPDPIFIPLMLMLVNLSLTEIHNLRQMETVSWLQKLLLNGSRVITIVIAVVATMNPSAVSFYWLCSSTIGIGQSLLLMSPRIRQALRIPKTGKESASPYADIMKNLKKRFRS